MDTTRLLALVAAGSTPAGPTASTGLAPATTTGPSPVGQALGSGMPSWLLIVVGVVVIALAVKVAASRGQQPPRRPEDGPRRPFRP